MIPEKITRVGVLGCSDIARRRFIPSLSRCRRAQLVAVASRTPDKAAACAEGDSCLRLTYDELLSSPWVDLVYLSLPNHLHEEWAMRVLEAGKHLICEKPLAMDLPAVQRIVRCAEKNNRLIYENQMFLFHPQHEVVRSLIAEGRVGRVRELRCFFGFPLPSPGNYRLDPKQGGGAFHDLARYPIGAALHFLEGRPRDFRGHATWHGHLNMAVHGTALTEVDETLTFSISFGQEYESLYEVVGESGRIRLERAFTTPPDYANRIVLTTGGSVTEIMVPPADHFQLMIDQIATRIQFGNGYEWFRDRAAMVACIAADMEKGCMERSPL